MLIGIRVIKTLVFLLTYFTCVIEITKNVAFKLSQLPIF